MNPYDKYHELDNHSMKMVLTFFIKDFYDGMEEMRESYGDNVAFLYVSDDMKWGRANIKDKENDLYFVGMGRSQGYSQSDLSICKKCALFLWLHIYIYRYFSRGGW